MSSGEEFEVDEILEQRKRKGVLEYLVHWKGFNDLYNSWEPALSLSDCTKVLKTWTAAVTTKRSRSKSRSTSRGRSSKSRSRSRSRGRPSKSETSPKRRSRSRSTGRKTTRSSPLTTVAKVQSSLEEQVVSRKTTKSSPLTTTVAKVESSLEEQVASRKLRSGVQAVEEKASTSKSETTVTSSSQVTTSKEALIVEQKTEVVKATVETVKAAPLVISEGSGMTTRSRAVRQVENDQNPAPKVAESPADEKTTWLWWFADHAVLVLFVIVSLIALSFTIESISGVRDKLVPDLGVLRQRLGESYDHFVQGVGAAYGNVADAAAHGFGHLKAAVFPQEATASQAPPPLPKQAAA